MERTMKRRAAAAAAALALVTGGAVLAGCGSDSSSSGGAAATTAAATTTEAPNGVEKLSATEILDASLKAANAATSVTVKGAITQEGQEVALDLELGTDAAQGSFSAQGINAEIRVVGGKSYFKLSGEDFAKAAGEGDNPELTKAISALLGDKWIAAPQEAGDDLGGLGEFGQKDNLLQGILEADGEVTVKGTGEVNGTPVVFLDDSQGDGTLAIQTVGEPYPIQIKGSGGGDSGEISFTNWNAPVSVTAPTDVIDLSALANLGDSGSGSTTSSN